MKHKKSAYSLSHVDKIAAQLAILLKKYPIMTFSGSLGAGKTTLIQELLRQCGVKERVTSPTFAYMHQYTNNQGNIFYHFDLYRLTSLDDFRMTGFDEYLYEPHSYVLIEWPEHILPLLQEQVCHVVLDYMHDQQGRTIHITCKQ